jgi:translation machinery-associated protein 16
VINVHAEVIDLTHPANVELFRQWDQVEVPYIQQLRFVRISSANPNTAALSRPGKHLTLLPEKNSDESKVDAMEVIET